MVTEPPDCPYDDLGEPGRSWWEWAWSTSQALKWDEGALYTVARRAQLEDYAAAMTFEDHLDLDDLLRGADPEAVRNIEWALSLLKRSASGAVTLMKEMRELETQLGLGPKAMAGLGWKKEEQRKDKLDELRDRRARRLGGAAS
jgi:hypothetical protein